MTWTPNESNPPGCPELDSIMTGTFDAQGFPEDSPTTCPESCRGTCTITPAVGSECAASVSVDGPCPEAGVREGGSVRGTYTFRGDTVTFQASGNSFEGVSGTCTYTGTGTRS